MTDAAVAIVIPTYSRAPLTTRAVNSVLAATSTEDAAIVLMTPRPMIHRAVLEQPTKGPISKF